MKEIWPGEYQFISMSIRKCEMRGNAKDFFSIKWDDVTPLRTYYPQWTWYHYLTKEMQDYKEIRNLNCPA